jgi:two-component system, NarL family, nitrate/nitrite response regulator NarL
VRVLVADDQPAIRNRVHLTLASQISVEEFDEAADGKEAVEKTERLHPDLVILDITMPVMNGLEAARRIRAISPQTPILILSMHNSRELVKEAQKIGVRGYVVKAEAGHTLVPAVNAVLNSQTFFPVER